MVLFGLSGTFANTRKWKISEWFFYIKKNWQLRKNIYNLSLLLFESRFYHRTYKKEKKK